LKENEIKKTVRERYAKIVEQESSCCVPDISCCGTTPSFQDISKKIGYSEEELAAVPESANLGLGCGNPVALASLREGETVLDLGSGAGLDCFIAANKVGRSGKVIGVDMTPEMILKARENTEKNNIENVEFRLGEIEHLPAADASVDVIISNCVINLSPEKPQVFREAFRILKPGGRMHISDIVLLKELPESILNSAEAYTGCVSGAIMKNDYIDTIKDAGFQSVEILDEKIFPIDLILSDKTVQAILDKLNISDSELKELENSIASITLRAGKA
jgi:ubiquinone/menaquinone biosynthesis C-methylase UbiE